jgi:hypothetical protein
MKNLVKNKSLILLVIITIIAIIAIIAIIKKKTLGKN